jgi:hypothetical protein
MDQRVVPLVDDAAERPDERPEELPRERLALLPRLRVECAAEPERRLLLPIVLEPPDPVEPLMEPEPPAPPDCPLMPAEVPPPVWAIAPPLNPSIAADANMAVRSFIS